MTKEQELALSAWIAENVMGWHLEHSIDGKGGIWVDSNNKYQAHVADYNLVANPADCAGVMDEVPLWEIWRHDTDDKPYYCGFAGKHGAWADTWTEAFILAVKAAWEGK